MDEYGNKNGMPQILGDAPAFPVSVPGCGDNGQHGMSLRDWFAGMALQGIIASEGTEMVVAKAAAERAYHLAYAMLERRAAPEGK